MAVGDACGYVEPFTGEGMAWAMAGAGLAVGMLPGRGEGWPGDLVDRWGAMERSVIGRRQRWCRALRVVMHHPTLAGVAVAMGRAVPAVGGFLASCLCEPGPGSGAESLQGDR